MNGDIGRIRIHDSSWIIEIEVLERNGENGHLDASMTNIPLSLSASIQNLTQMTTQSGLVCTLPQENNKKDTVVRVSDFWAQLDEFFRIFLDSTNEKCSSVKKEEFPSKFNL